jgi:DNA-binding NarL/FixJ family response regulator
MPGRIVALVPDLLIGSRIEESARRIDADLQSISSELQLESALVKPTDVVVVDLAVPGLNFANIVTASRAANVAIVAFGPHVDVDLLKSARTAGMNAVYPRSSFLKHLNVILSDLLAAH